MDTGVEIALVVGVAAGLAGIAAMLAAVVTIGRAHQRLADAAAEVTALRARVDALAREVQETPARPAENLDNAPAEYLITTVGQTVPDTALVTTGSFASLAAAESMVKVISLAHGIRHALSAETRNRIRFEMRREVKRARKQRRRDLKEARRNLRSDERGQEAA